jgi:hypothetical protein
VGTLFVMNVIFGYVVVEENDSVDYLRALETYLQSSSNVVVKQQQEINELQTLCRTLKRVSKFYILYARMKGSLM